MRVTRHPQVSCIPEVDTQLYQVIPDGMRDVIHELKLALLFVQRAVTLIHRQRISEHKSACAVQGESRHAGRIRIVEIQARYSRIFCRRRANTVRIDLDTIMEPTEAKVLQPVRTVLARLRQKMREYRA